MYEAIRDDVDELIEILKTQPNNESHFYSIRNLDRDRELYRQLSKTERAARILYLNKTCFNGLYRVNNAGEFNAPFGFYRKPNIVNETTLKAVSDYFNNTEIAFYSTSYERILETIPKGTFVYLDPPYDPVSNTANFTGYSQGGFRKEDQIHLRECCDKLDKKGIHFMLSNSATEFIREQYKKYHIVLVKAKRAVNSDATKRGYVDEVVIRNYE